MEQLPVPVPGAALATATQAADESGGKGRLARQARGKVSRKREADAESELPGGGFDGHVGADVAKLDDGGGADDDDDDKEGGREGKKAKLPSAAVAVLKEWLLSPEHFDYPYPSDEVRLMF